MSENKVILGSLWEKTSKKGLSFFSGTLYIEGKKIKIVAFKQFQKKKETSPDWLIYESIQTPQTTQETNITKSLFPNDDDIPF